jgi:transposase-like protein
MCAPYPPFDQKSVSPKRLERTLLLQALIDLVGASVDRADRIRPAGSLALASMIQCGAPLFLPKNRDRLLAGDGTVRSLAAVLAHPKVKGVLSTWRFSMDGTLARAWTSPWSWRVADDPRHPRREVCRRGGGASRRSMAERRARRSFTGEFKARAAGRRLEGGKGLSEVATELGIGVGQLSQSRTEHLAAGSAEALRRPHGRAGGDAAPEKRVKRLEEAEILRQAAAASFARGIA